jgi:homoserine kinase type II
MLWESSDAQAALTQRFQFVSAEETVRWLVDTVARTYGILVVSVDRIVISHYNLLAWLTTAAGPLIAKCCALVSSHSWLLDVGELLLWLQEKHLPVSAPLLSNTGQVQVLSDHLSLGVQRVIAGDLLDPTQLGQARSAGITLAQLHDALAAYPRASDFVRQASIPSLRETINAWVEKKEASLTDPALVAGSKALVQWLQRNDLPDLATQVVHNDYRAANILWQEGKITAVLDFEDLSWGYRVNDLAWATVHLGTRFRQWGPVSADVHEAFRAGYESRQPLTEAEQMWLPALMVCHSINLACSAAGGPTYAAGIDSVTTYTHRFEAMQTYDLNVT